MPPAEQLPAPSRLERQTYSPSQIEAYYERIALPKGQRIRPGVESSTVAQDPEKGLAFLTHLQQYHLANIPFENLDLHYNRHRDIFIDLPHLFRKIVESGRGRGGYCMESNGLFGVMLRSLGFDVYPVAARIYNANVPLSEATRPSFNGWSHMLHIVTLGTRRYYVDVAFGSSGPSAPISLDEISASPVVNIIPQKRRLTRSPLPDSVRKTGTEQHLWIYEVQNEPGKAGPWLPMYCFGDLEFLLADFEVLNFYTSRTPRLFFTQKIVCEKHIFEDGVAVGTLSLFERRFKRRERGQLTLVIDFKSEHERIEALQQHFGVILTADERMAISGYFSEIRQ